MAVFADEMTRQLRIYMIPTRSQTTYVRRRNAEEEAREEMEENQAKLRELAKKMKSGWGAAEDYQIGKVTAPVVETASLLPTGTGNTR